MTVSVITILATTIHAITVYAITTQAIKVVPHIFMFEGQLRKYEAALQP